LKDIGAGNVGRIWYVIPVADNNNRFNGRLIKIEVLCNLKPGDKVIDSNTGRVFVLVCKDACECLWVAESMIERGTKYISGCIEYFGLPPLATLPADKEGLQEGVFQLLLDGQLNVLVDINGTLTWQEVTGTPIEYYYAAESTELARPEIQIYYVRKKATQNSPGSQNNACNQFDGGGNQIISVQNIKEACNILQGDKFLDCKTDNLYTFGQAIIEGEAALGTTGWTSLCIVCEDTSQKCDCECLKNGCIKYSGICGDSVPTETGEFPVGTYFLDLSDADLYVVSEINTTKKWIIVNETQPYLYFCYTSEDLPLKGNGSIYQVNPQEDVHSKEPGTTELLNKKCNLKVKTKFIDCCTGIIYTLTSDDGEWRCGPDFPLTADGDCNTPLSIDCCKLNGSSGQKLECDVVIDKKGWTQKVTDPNNVGPFGTNLLTLNDGTLYISDGTKWVAQPPSGDIYYLCTQTDNGDPPFQIYFDNTNLGDPPVKVEDKLNLSLGDKLLDCTASIIYELDINEEGKTFWRTCCNLRDICPVVIGKDAKAIGATPDFTEKSTVVGCEAEGFNVLATAFGYKAKANQRSVAIGGESLSGQQAVAIGCSADAGQTQSIAIGSGAKSSSLNSISIGPGSQAIHTNSFCGGFEAKSRVNNENVFSSFRSIRYNIATTDATITSVTYPGLINEVVVCDVSISATTTGGGANITDAAAWSFIKFAYIVKNSVASIQPVGANKVQIFNESTWDADVNFTGKDLRIQVTGAAATTVQWAINLTIYTSNATQ